MRQTRQPGFDYVVHRRNPKTKEVTSVNPYRQYRINGKVFNERPVGSGNLWYEDGSPAGRMISKDGVKEPDLKAEHINWEPPKTDDQKLKEFVVKTEQKSEALEKELQALKAEHEALLKSKSNSAQNLQDKEEKKDGPNRRTHSAAKK